MIDGPLSVRPSVRHRHLHSPNGKEFFKAVFFIRILSIVPCAFWGIGVMVMHGSAVGACQVCFPIPSHVFLAGVCEGVISQVRYQKVSTRREKFLSFGILRIFSSVLELWPKMCVFWLPYAPMYF